MRVTCIAPLALAADPHTINTVIIVFRGYQRLGGNAPNLARRIDNRIIRRLTIPTEIDWVECIECTEGGA